MGDFSKMGKLADMYTHCKTEDPDITPVDFVFEHLLNLESLIHSFEKQDNKEKEFPHHPVRVNTNVNHVVLNITHFSFFENNSVNEDNEPHSSTTKNPFIPTGYSTTIFRPPII